VSPFEYVSGYVGVLGRDGEESNLSEDTGRRLAEALSYSP